MSRLGVAVGTSAQLAYRENTAWDKAFLPFSFCPVKHLRCAGARGRRGPEPADGQQPLRSALPAPSRVRRGGVYWVGVPEAVSRTPRGSARGWPQFMGRPPPRALESAGRGTAGGTGPRRDRDSGHSAERVGSGAGAGRRQVLLGQRLSPVSLGPGQGPGCGSSGLGPDSAVDSVGSLL